MVMSALPRDQYRALGLSTLAFLDSRSFLGFFVMFLLLFFFSGVGNASTTQMIPAIFRQQTPLLNPGLSPAEQRLQSDKESAAAVGFISAVAAYGAFCNSQGLWQRHRPERQRLAGAVWLHRLLRNLYRPDLVLLHPPQRGGALLT